MRTFRTEAQLASGQDSHLRLGEPFNTTAVCDVGYVPVPVLARCRLSFRGGGSPGPEFRKLLLPAVNGKAAREEKAGMNDLSLGSIDSAGVSNAPEFDGESQRK